MLCEKCQKNVATFHYTEVVNGVKNEHHLCLSLIHIFNRRLIKINKRSI